jgi:hypothetical protein
MKSPFDDDSPIPKIEMLSVLDLRPYSRRSDVCLTEVKIVDTGWRSGHILWIQAGEAQIRTNEKDQSAELKIYWDGVTDEEHDSAYILILPLIGVTMTTLYYHTITLNAWVSPTDHESFRVPSPGYPNPSTTHKCPTCNGNEDREAHLIGPYIPKVNLELFKVLRGRRLEIHIGPVP